MKVFRPLVNKPNLSSATLLLPTWNSVTPSVVILLLLIAQSMDVHSNPGPTAIHIIKDLTTPLQRKLYNNAKRLQLNVTRYEHHIFQMTIITGHTRSLPRDLLSNVDLHSILMINIFFEAGDHFLGKRHFRR